MALPKQYRLKKTKDFDRIFKEGKTVRGSFFFIKFRPNNQRHARIAAVVSSKTIKTSTQRHHILRQVLNVLYNKRYFLWPLDIVVVISAPILEKSYQEIKTELAASLNKLNFPS